MLIPSGSPCLSQSLVVAHREWSMEGGTGGAGSQMGWWEGFCGYRRGRRGRRAIWLWFSEMTFLAPHPQHPQSMATCLPLHQLLNKLQVAELQVQLQLMTTPAILEGIKLAL